MYCFKEGLYINKCEITLQQSSALFLKHLISAAVQFLQLACQLLHPNIQINQISLNTRFTLIPLRLECFSFYLEYSPKTVKKAEHELQADEIRAAIRLLK